MTRVSAEAVDELNALAATEPLTPARVLERASDASSALHPMFTWDDEEAGHAHRLSEARQIIRSVRVTILPQPGAVPIRVRAFVSLADDRIVGGGYRPVVQVMSDPAQRAALLQTALCELGALQRRYAHLSELAQVFAALDTVARTG